ncbi:MAG: hypothetical protein IT182_13645 [Acidobacteria bacterium]|nr:hypothetical protein [Acidobacteriota bacterium]
MTLSTLSRLLGPAALLVLLAASPSVAQDAAIGTAPAAAATIQQVGFIAGQWTGTLGDRHIEQHWMAPAATSMVAVYRNVQGTEPRLYELLAIEQEGDGLVLRIKHFAPGPGLAGRQPQAESVNHRLVKVEGRTAVFEGTGPNPSRVTFTRKAPDALDIIVARNANGKLTETVFAYTQVK